MIPSFATPKSRKTAEKLLTNLLYIHMSSHSCICKRYFNCANRNFNVSTSSIGSYCVLFVMSSEQRQACMSRIGVSDREKIYAVFREIEAAV